LNITLHDGIYRDMHGIFLCPQSSVGKPQIHRNGIIRI
jgi:hypothetical protein